jgi:putative hemolysin
MIDPKFFVLIGMIVISAVFSGTETAMMAVSMIKAKSLLEQKKKGAEAFFRLKQNTHKLIITVMIMNNLANIGAASIATILFTDLFGSSGVGIATGVMTFFILVFGEITPKTYCAQNAEKISLIMARPIELISILLTPIVKILEIITKSITRLFGSKEHKELSQEELRTMLTMGREEGILTKEASNMMRNVLEFEGTKVTEIMVPKAHIHMVDANKKLREVVDYVVKTPFSRYPAYSKDKDHVVGILDVDDVLEYVKNHKLDVKIKPLLKKAFFVPESKEIDDLLTQFQGKKTPLAIVVDEYGNISGLVAVEDILEEIVGDIFDKSKRESVLIKKVNENLIRVDAKISVEEINKNLHLGIREKHFNTLAGFIEHKLGRVPKKGEVISLRKVKIAVDEVTEQEIRSVKILKH